MTTSCAPSGVCTPTWHVLAFALSWVGRYGLAKRRFDFGSARVLSCVNGVHVYIHLARCAVARNRRQNIHEFSLLTRFARGLLVRRRAARRKKHKSSAYCPLSLHVQRAPRPPLSGFFANVALFLYISVKATEIPIFRCPFSPETTKRSSSTRRLHRPCERGV